jgi:hypothetical protein
MRRSIPVRATVVVVAALLLATPAAPASPAQATPAVARDPAVITTWDAIAVRTIIVQGLKPPPVAQLYLGFVSAAMYSAVVTIDGRFTPTPPNRAHPPMPHPKRPPPPLPTGCSASTSRPRPSS